MVRLRKAKGSLRFVAITSTVAWILVGAVAGAAGHHVGPTPRVFAVSATLHDGATISEGCGEGMATGPSPAVFYALTVTEADGRHSLLHMYLEDRPSTIELGARVGQVPSVHASTVPLWATPIGPTSFSFGHALSDGAVLRAAWATWDASFPCSVVVDGVELEPVELDPVRALRARPTDFEGGIAARADLVAAAYEQTLEYEAHGYVFAALHHDIGGMWVDGPSGYRSNEDSYDSCLLTVAEPVEGRLTFGLDTSFTANSAHGLFLVELDE